MENSVAERANGILKTEWLYYMEPLPEKQCPDTIGRIIAFYNDDRPRMSIGYQTPSAFAKRKATLDCPAVMEQHDNRFRDSEAKERETVNPFRDKGDKQKKA